MRKIRRVAAFPIWWLCWVFDSIPTFDSIDHHWYRRGGHGCYPLRISRLAMWIEGKSDD